MRLGQLRRRGGDRRPLAFQPGLGAGDGVLGLVEVLGGDEIRRRQTLEAGVFSLGGAHLHPDGVDLGLGLGEVGRRGLGRQAWLVVLEPGQDLALADGVAFLDEDLAHDAGGARRHLDDAALDVGLAAGDGGIGGIQRMRLGHRLGAGLLRIHAAHGQAADHHHDDGQHAEPEGGFAQKGHDASIRVAASSLGVTAADSRIWPSSRWMTRSA